MIIMQPRPRLSSGGIGDGHHSAAGFLELPMLTCTSSSPPIGCDPALPGGRERWRQKANVFSHDDPRTNQIRQTGARPLLAAFPYAAPRLRAGESGRPRRGPPRPSRFLGAVSCRRVRGLFLLPAAAFPRCDPALALASPLPIIRKR